MQILPRLRPYQCDAGRAILASVRGRLSRSFSVEIARQGGKNELSAQIELLLLLIGGGGDLIKCAPTLTPQGRISLERLWLRLQQAGLAPPAEREGSNAVRLGPSRFLVLSASPDASVVGHTAGLLLEVDEAQDVEREKFEREFRPMAAARGATIVFYGTAWDETGLLEQQKQHHLELERRDGIQRHFEYPWDIVARFNPIYRRFVEGERERLGEDHPLFQTQYCLRPISGGGRLFSAARRALLQGQHARLRAPGQADPGATFVAGLDVGGEALESASGGREHDSTVLTIARIRHEQHDDAAIGPAMGDPLLPDPEPIGPDLDVVEHYAWEAVPQDRLVREILPLLRDVWRVQRVAVDATGVGEGLAAMLARHLGTARVLRLRFSTELKSRLGFGLLAAAAGRLRCYAADGSPEYRAFWREVELARAVYRSNRTMSFFVDPAEGHDDYLVSLALVVEAARGWQPRVARGRLRAEG